MFANIAEVVELMRAGQVRGLALAAARPTPLAPELPLLTRNFPALDMDNWFGLVGPVGMPAELVQQLGRAFTEALADPATRPVLEARGLHPIPDPSPRRASAATASVARAGGAGQHPRGSREVTRPHGLLARHRHRRHLHRHRRLRPRRAAGSCSRKVLTTPRRPRPRRSPPACAALLARDRLAPRAFTRVVHATTLFTNALIERKGARHRAHHHRGLPRHARDRARAEVRALRPRHRQAGAAGAAPPAAGGAPSACAPTAACATPLDRDASWRRGAAGWSQARRRRRSPSCSCTPTPTRAHEAAGGAAHRAAPSRRSR